MLFRSAGLVAFRASSANVLIGLGGGSPQDTCKAISVIATNPDFEDVLSLEGLSYDRIQRKGYNVNGYRNICDNCCSISDLEAWESTDSFFEYLNENIMGLLSSYWRIDSDNGDQYAVENIIKLNDDRKREICGC